MEKFLSEIAGLIEKHAGIPAADAAKLLASPPNPAMGDIGFPCFTLAKTKRTAPNKIAQELAAVIKPTEKIIRVSAEGPYLNFTFNRGAFAAEVIREINAAGEKYGASDEGRGRTILLDFSSPNIAKPFGVGHLRSTLIGAALYRIYENLGYKAVGINHIGDWGTQFGKMISAWKRWGGEDTFGEHSVGKMYDLYVRFHKEAEQNPSLEDEARVYFGKLESGDAEMLALWKRFVDASYVEFERIYKMLGVRFDEVKGESFYNDKMEAALERVRASGMLAQSEGASGVDLAGEKLGFGMLMKSDGATVYLLRDLAAAYYRRETYKPEKILYVVGAPQQLHFKQLRAILSLMKETWADKIVHVAFGHILGMSTRKGTLVFADDFIEEAKRRALDIIMEKNPEMENREEVANAVAIGAIVFNDLSQRRIKDIQFDWDRMLALDGDTGPYLQYLRVRIAGILRKSAEKPADAANAGKTNYAFIASDEEFALVKELAKFPGAVKQAAEEYEPSILAGALIELAHAFHAFYQKHQVLVDDADLRNARLELVKAVKIVISNGLGLLGIKPIERM
jgi:arginyl-tRNA synthetase